ncbi:NAD(P)H-hydrate dehydratase [Sphingomonas sp. KRR8]|uniref:NAD(P)H-hydrate dehydratase n=1 Tax=Sphingomonas sp. KRR8 TaxID=2942996 RepID=UPI0020205CCE|nr:NAD(P)H-hydrate dehydratase [Sphingomonas sp. KRR8]URD61675.1 NAD(P)H-hydrate dehydratase [Sphingomonas sp. KRR8]
MRPILTAAAMRTAEEQAIAAGTSIETLMGRAGASLALAVLRFAGPEPTLVLCGPGNNGGDGYVAARHLAAAGVDVRIAAMAEPVTDVARWARGLWSGPVERLENAKPASVLVDCLFGTGLKRGLEDVVQQRLCDLSRRSQLTVCADLPSGVEADSGAILSAVPKAHLTVSFGALKPAHRLMPAMACTGRLVLADIGIAADLRWHEITRPELPPIAPDAHKYNRGLVHALAGKMPGAIALAASAAARTGAGYVRVSTSRVIEHLPAAVVQTDTATLADPRIGCILVGPGMGDLPQILTLALTSHAPKVIDADGIGQIGEPERLRGQDAIVTPHAGEFAKLFGDLPGTKAEQALAAAERSGAVIVFKGPDTLVASPDGRLGFAPPAPSWLATAGTGDVLAGMIAALRARGLPAFEAASAGVWLHGRAAERAGPAMIADDLLASIPLVL